MATKGLFLQAGVGGAVQPVTIDGIEDIQRAVGGLFDCVRATVNDDIIAVGYVHDEGLLLDLDMNWIASALFMQEIRGDVVLVNGCSPSGDYDGDNHDLPDEFIAYMMTTFLANVAVRYNETVMLTEAMTYAVESGAVTEQEIDDLLDDMESANGSRSPEEYNELRKRMEEILTKVEEHRTKHEVDGLIEEIYDFLKEQK